MKRTTKYTIASIAASCSLAFSPLALASGSASGGGAGQTQILSKIYGILHASADAATALTYQADAFLSQIEGSQTAGTQLTASNLPSNQSGQKGPQYAKLGLNNYIPWQSGYNQANAITSDMNAIPTSLQNGSVNPNANLSWLASEQGSRDVSGGTGSQSSKNASSNALAQLTIGTPAADTLYLPQSSINKLQNCDPSKDSSCSAKLAANLQYMQSLLKKPTTMHNSYFNLSTFLFPPNGSYTSAKTDKAYSDNAAKAYVTYLTENYKPLTAGLNLNQLSYLHGNKQANAIYNLITSPQYQQYQMDVRNIVASRSLTDTMLNQLAIERTGSKTLGSAAKSANIPTKYYDSKAGTMSPLQMENYIAYHRLNNPQWYGAMSQASPATVQRETLFVLAAILGKLQQAHIDREKQLVLTDMQVAQSTGGLEKLIQSDANDVNTQISKATGQKSSGAAQTSQSKQLVSDVLGKN